MKGAKRPAALFFGSVTEQCGPKVYKTVSGMSIVTIVRTKQFPLLANSQHPFYRTRWRTKIMDYERIYICSIANSLIAAFYGSRLTLVRRGG